MRIDNVKPLLKTQQISVSEKEAVSSPAQNPIRYDNVSYSQIPFCAMYNVKPKKLLNVPFEKSKLLAHLADILETQPLDISEEELMLLEARNKLVHMKMKVDKMAELNRRLDEVKNDLAGNPQIRIARALALKKEFSALVKSKPMPVKKEKPTDERIDFQLINKFKAAVSNDDYGLQKVFDKYYSGLANISSIDELKAAFPKIKLPPNPIDVISTKIAKTFTRDFYEQFDELFCENIDKAVKFADNQITEKLSGISAKFKLPVETLYEKLSENIHTFIAQRYSAVRKSGFNIVPQQIKQSTFAISDTDIKLLSVDFDDFVLSTVKKLYLNAEKPNDIVYSANGVTVPLKNLSQTEYKVERVPEKVLSIIRTAKAIRESQRGYELFDMHALQDRLEYYAGTEICENEKLLGSLMDFVSCNKEDAVHLRKLLRELDSVFDGDKTVEQCLETIKAEKIKPHETQRLSELERQKAIELFKREQQQAFKLNKLKSDFDDSINVLYAHNMNSLANMCAQYAPKSLDEVSVENANFIMKLIKSNLRDGESVNIHKLEAQLTNWDTFNRYKTQDSETDLFKRALEYAKNFSDREAEMKAGQYLANAEIVDLYPQSLDVIPDSELVSKIIERASDKTKAVEHLCKLSDYKALSAVDKTYLSKFIDNFDLKDPADKAIVKHIIEQDYSQNDTANIVKLYENSDETIVASINAKAKQAIVEKYKFPTCIEYLRDFEDALSNGLVGAKGASGIKQTGRNNKAAEYKIELKIIGHDDRLFSSKNDFNFDIFSERGMH